MLMTVGTKVEVIASTAKKKGAKPRNGSQGYCATSDAIRMIGGLNILAVPASITFTRYGQQTRRRSETKRVCLIYPRDQRNIANTQQYLNKLLKHSKDFNHIKHVMTIARIPPKIFPTLLVVKPILTSENIINSNNEFISWMHCVLRSPSLNKILYVTYKNEKSLLRNNFLKGLPVTLLDLRKALENKYAFENLSKFFLKFPKHRQALLSSVVRLNYSLTEIMINEAQRSISAQWKADQRCEKAALIFGALDRPMTVDEGIKFAHRLSPSAHRAYYSMEKWLKVLNTL